MQSLLHRQRRARGSSGGQHPERRPSDRPCLRTRCSARSLSRYREAHRGSRLDRGQQSHAGVLNASFGQDAPPREVTKCYRLPTLGLHRALIGRCGDLVRYCQDGVVTRSWRCPNRRSPGRSQLHSAGLTSRSATQRFAPHSTITAPSGRGDLPFLVGKPHFDVRVNPPAGAPA